MDYQNWCSVDENSIPEIDQFEPPPPAAIRSRAVEEGGIGAAGVSAGAAVADTGGDTASVDPWAAGITHLLPSLRIFKCHNIKQLKLKILEFYRPGPETVTSKGLQDMHQPTLPHAAGQVTDLMNFFFGKNAMNNRR